MIKAYDNDENEEETNGRNFTVVIPEELNKIDVNHLKFQIFSNIITKYEMIFKARRIESG